VGRTQKKIPESFWQREGFFEFAVFSVAAAWGDGISFVLLLVDFISLWS